MGILVKTKQQIEGIRKSCKLAAATLRHVAPFVKSGVTTEELNQICDKYIRDNGAISAPLGYMGYPKATCISINEVICHGIPGDRVLKEGDIVNIDVTTILNGYFGDTSTMFAIGEVSEDAKQLMAVTKKCVDIGIKQVRHGNHFSNIGYEIQRYALLQRCTVVYQFCGHGVGVQFHEEPEVSHCSSYKNVGPRMKTGMIFTIEPMINLGVPDAIIDEDKWTARTADGMLSAQYEHTVLVTPKGFEILTE